MFSEMNEVFIKNIIIGMLNALIVLQSTLILINKVKLKSKRKGKSEID